MPKGGKGGKYYCYGGCGRVHCYAFGCLSPANISPKYAPPDAKYLFWGNVPFRYCIGCRVLNGEFWCEDCYKRETGES